MTFTVLSRGASACALMLASVASAEAQVSLPQIVVGAARAAPTAPPLEKAGDEAVVTQKEIVAEKPPETDTAKLLERQPGVSVQTGGGVSGLPAIRGLADDRLKIVVGGVQTTATCANHMNSPLSYTDPNTIGRVEVVTAVSSVTKGGDSIGGSILVTPISPVFATPVVAPAVIGPAGAPISPIVAVSPYPPVPYLPLPVPGTLRFGPNNEVLATGSISAFFRGNNNGVGVSANINMANDHWSLLYNGSWQRATDYHAGGNGDKVLSTSFISENHAVTLGYQNEGHLFTFRGAYQNIPYQGFPNQRMDMIRNRSYSLDANYKGAYAWGTLEARAYWHQVFHKMGFLEDRFWLNHPMIALGRDFGYSVRAEIPYSEQDTFRIGNEFHGYRLQDYWPNDWTGFPNFATMPRQFAQLNINGGQRNRVGTYAEWERRWTPQWSSLVGVRNDVVWMDTGPGRSYTPFTLTNPNVIAVNLFNAQNRARTDVNFDMTALARYEPEPGSLYEFGYSRKTRSPNLYERYTWPMFGAFTAMFNWFGDGNGYTGNLNLKPEVAHNVAITGAWRDMSGANNWEARISPFYTYVENYIDGGRTGGTFNTFPVANSYIFQIMQFRNFNAELYGVDGSGRIKLHESPEYGRLQAVGVVSFVYGRNLDIGNPQYCLPGNGFCSVASFLIKKGDGLWNLMPANARIALEHQIGGLSMAAETQLVAPKDHVSANKGEFITPAYALLNLRAAYEWSNMRIDLGVDNLTDALYSLPLGGFDLTNYSRNAFLFGRNVGLASVRQVPGMGRNFYAGLTVRF
ncbi:TonB-dependent receptor [Methylocystis sp.]|uniref:TonB-dependent receptor n=1 Tax=Methylocystis sp. TaxID=1911079 RepID=UPI0025F210E2|nr:TonB-dependent receptor plug domain-containing protein [Methylocystis sp.]